MDSWRGPSGGEVVAEVLKRRGAIASAKIRAPGPSLTETVKAELTRLIERVEMRLSALGRAA